ncbi:MULTISPECIES: hypothetical protein [unclassified Sphingomonas]|uniref:hypothetical protein n=1 Tax=unclassified Sphingomonas TaxID=196159 RepID=UPI000BC4E55A|nr:MAG: hypothetical protein B7Y98_09310 [Sphingomonas sp. 32-62-10]
MTTISSERIAQIAARRDELQALMATNELPFFRHPGLEPGSRFFGAGQGSGTPGQARGDGLGLGPLTKLFFRHSREGGNPAYAASRVELEGSGTPAFAGVTDQGGRSR